MNILGRGLFGLSIVAGFVVYALTVIALFSSGEAGLALLALFVPPADVLLAFYVSPMLGLVGLSTIALFFLAAVTGASER